MGMGNYDQQEYERRESKISEIESDTDEQPNEYRGELTFDEGTSTDELLKLHGWWSGSYEHKPFDLNNPLLKCSNLFEIIYDGLWSDAS